MVAVTRIERRDEQEKIGKEKKKMSRKKTRTRGIEFQRNDHVDYHVGIFSEEKKKKIES